MRPRRYQLEEVLNRNGRIVAHLFDSKLGAHLWIHRLNGRLYHWNKLDKPVSNAKVRLEANLALDTHLEAQMETPGNKRSCRDCGEIFAPAMKNSRARLCRDCRWRGTQAKRKAAA